MQRVASMRTGLLFRQAVVSLLFLFFLHHSTQAVAVVDPGARLTVYFAGFSAVHTEVRLPDGNTGLAEGRRIARAYWKKDRAEIRVPAGVYDLRIRKGPATLVIDDLDCRSGACEVRVPVATLSVEFPGMSSVHTDVRMPDGLEGSAEGAYVAKANWKTDRAEIKLFPGVYDLRVRKGKSTVVIDELDCTAASCHADLTPKTLVVEFPGMKSVHTDVRLPDGVAGSAEGAYVAKANWKTDRAEILVFPGIYDLRVRKGRSTTVVDKVDCVSGACRAEVRPKTLTVEFAGMSGVHTQVRTADAAIGSAEGAVVAKANWKTDRAEILVFPGIYDLRVRKGRSTIVIDKVDCVSGACRAELEPKTLVVEFPGLKGVHTEVRLADGSVGEANGDKLAKANWRTDRAEMRVFPGIYDLRVRRGGAEMIVDGVDCLSGDCRADLKPVTLKVHFPGMSSVHTDVRVPDGKPGEATGKVVGKANWRTDVAEIKVLPLVYDLRIRKGAASRVVDRVDCRTGVCEVDELTADLLVEFPGLANVRTEVFVPDGVDGRVGDARITRVGSRRHQARLRVFRQVVDVRVKHVGTSVFDRVDCRPGKCRVAVEGDLQASLIDADSNRPLANRALWVYEKLPDGKLTRKLRGITNEQGKVHFPLADLRAGKTHVLYTQDPFGQGKRYFSALISAPGPFPFRITRDGDYPLDTRPPTLAIGSPAEGDKVPAAGFRVEGRADDDNQIEAVTLAVVDPVKGRSQVPVRYSAPDGTWVAEVSAAMISVDRNIELSVSATDRAQNAQSVSRSVMVIDDIQGPEIRILSHADDASVSSTGFLLSGLVIDDTGVAALRASVFDSLRNTTSVTDRPLEFAADSGAWSLAVNNGELTAGATATVTLVAEDTQGNRSTEVLNLNVVAVDNSARHMINRITFGPTPDLLDRVEAGGALAYLEQQLDPAGIDDSAFEAMIAGPEPDTKEALQALVLKHMIFSRRQLREVMTWFWDNHFNTDIGTRREDADGRELEIGVADEWHENQLFRQHALGNFRDLLEASAKSRAMLIYLDSISNVDTDSNENYAREVMELHTVGVNAGYTDADVAAAAEVFTGWTVSGDAFFFDAARHNTDAQTVFGAQIPSGDQEQGERLLDHLAGHPRTARFLCAKLATLLVSDSPPESLVDRCADTFLAERQAPNQIAEVLRVILTSPEFAAEYRSKIKSPVELVVGTVRALEAETDASDLPGALAAMGLRLFENPVPTGYAEVGDVWINSNLLIERMKWVNTLVREASGSATSVDPLAFFTALGHETSEGIVNYLLRLTLGDDYDGLERQQAETLLNRPDAFDIGAPDARQRLRRLEGGVLSFPQYQFQ